MFYPHKINHDGIIIDGHTGNITFEAMRWLSKQQHQSDAVELEWSTIGKRHIRAAKIRQITHKTVSKIS